MGAMGSHTTNYTNQNADQQKLSACRREFMRRGDREQEGKGYTKN